MLCQIIECNNSDSPQLTCIFTPNVIIGSWILKISSLELNFVLNSCNSFDGGLSRLMPAIHSKLCEAFGIVCEVEICFPTMYQESYRD